MKNHRSSILVERDCKTVYALLSDFRNDARWRHDVDSSTLISGEVGKPGARYEQSATRGKKKATATVEMTFARPGEAVGFQTVDAGPMAVSGTYSVQPEQSGTRVTFDITLSPRGWLKLFGPLMGPVLRKQTDRYLQDLKSALEG